ncbi:hypothetical protein RIF29_14559 [Crotalaria pallida]|uniref:Uncharacterized protein n=1 Tax=Crotalaria pallida TaxID=3830 RepID=A0AAN9FBI4_CROPI
MVVDETQNGKEVPPTGSAAGNMGSADLVQQVPLNQGNLNEKNKEENLVASDDNNIYVPRMLVRRYNKRKTTPSKMKENLRAMNYGGKHMEEISQQVENASGSRFESLELQGWAVEDEYCAGPTTSKAAHEETSSRSPFGIARLVDMEDPTCRAHGGGGSITYPKSILLYSQFQPAISTTFSPCGGERLRFNGWWRLLKG